MAWCLSLCVCHKPEYYRNTWMDIAGFGVGFIRPILHCVIRKFKYMYA